VSASKLGFYAIQVSLSSCAHLVNAFCGLQPAITMYVCTFQFGQPNKEYTRIKAAQNIIHPKENGYD
jgi:hypothetical protein